jgi:hypothetical protein
VRVDLIIEEVRMADLLSVKFKVTAPETLRYWLAIDEDDLTLNQGEAVVDLEVGTQYVLVWWMIGNAGDAVSIVGKAGEREVVNVKESKVPTGTTKGAGYRKFTP